MITITQDEFDRAILVVQDIAQTVEGDRIELRIGRADRLPDGTVDYPAMTAIATSWDRTATGWSLSPDCGIQVA